MHILRFLNKPKYNWFYIKNVFLNIFSFDVFMLRHAKLTNAWFILKPVTVVKSNMWVKLLTNSIFDRTIIKAIVGNINVVKHVCNKTYMSIFAAGIIIV